MPSYELGYHSSQYAILELYVHQSLYGEDFILALMEYVELIGVVSFKVFLQRSSMGKIVSGLIPDSIKQEFELN